MLLAVAAALAPGSVRAWDGEPPDIPKPSQIGKPAKAKKIPPTTIREVPGLVSKCTRRIRQVCRQIIADMNAINRIYEDMLREADRRLKAGGLTRAQQNNLNAMGRYLKAEHTRMTEVATGKSPSYVPQRNRRSGPTFCDNAEDALKKVAGNLSDYNKRGRSNRDRVNDIKGMRKNFGTATRGITNARDGYISRAYRGGPKLDRTVKAAGTEGIYTPARKKRIDALMNKLRNSSSVVFEINVKFEELQAWSIKIYGRG